MSIRAFVFCDLCNPVAARSIEQRRGTRRDGGDGRRIEDGRAWFEGTAEEAVEAAGWTITSDGRHVCPRCRARHADPVWTTRD